MNWKCYVGCVFLFMFGAYIGYLTPTKSRYQEGRVSACTEMLDGATKAIPFLALAKLECVPFKGDAAIKSGDDLYSLDGNKKLN